MDTNCDLNGGEKLKNRYYIMPYVEYLDWRKQILEESVDEPPIHFCEMDQLQFLLGYYTGRLHNRGEKSQHWEQRITVIREEIERRKI